MSRTTALLVLLLLVVPAVPVIAQADQGLGVTPAEVEIATGQPGEAYRAIVEIQNEFDSETRIELKPTGEVGAWTTTDHADSFTIPARTHERVELTIRIPSGAVNGSYQGQLQVTADPKEQPSGSGASIQYAVAVLLNVTIGGQPVRDLVWGEATAEDVEIGSSPQVSARVLNSGNVRDTARAQATITPLNGSTELATATGELRLDPGQEGMLDFPFDHALPEGQYQVHLEEDGGDFEATLSFKVVPPGVLGKDGTLRFISHEPWVAVDRPVEIAGVFENTGTSRIARATFTARILLDGELVGALESQPRVLEAGHLVNLTDVFTPDQPGTYHIEGTVTYDGFQTDQKTSILNVQGDAPGDAGLVRGIAAYLLMGLLALAGLVYLIARLRPHDDGDGE